MRAKGVECLTVQAFTLALVTLLLTSFPGLADIAAAQQAPPKIVRFVFAPDPIWDWLRDEGILEEYEKAYNVRVNQISTWDEFSFFAGGHADIASMATFELPIFQRQTGQDLVVFGKYMKTRSILLVRRDSPAQTLADLKGQRIAGASAVSVTLLWGAIAKEMHGLDLRAGGGDFQFIVSRHQVMPELVRRGDLAMCMCLADFAARYMRTGELRGLYDGREMWEIYRDRYDDTRSGQTLMNNLFVARKEWFEANPDVVRFFLDLWQRGLEEWKQNKAKIIARYPQHFGVEDKEDIEWLIKYMDERNWFVDDVRLTEEWIAEETKVFRLMKATGFMEEDAPEAEWVVVN